MLFLKVACEGAIQQLPKQKFQSNSGELILPTEWTVRDVLDWTKGYFQEAGIEKSRLDAEILLAHTLEMERIELYLEPNRPVSQEELNEYKPLIKKRKGGVPLQYITGQVNFMGLTLRVDKRALIPRPETEELIEELISNHRESENLRVLDLGTGSGAISIALAKFLVRPTILATDVDVSALELAKENAELNEVEDRIEFRQSNWFDSIDGSFDLIVTNPPYVAADELEDLSPKIKDQEPTIALDGGEDGMEDIAHILQNAPSYLTTSGCLYMEIGHEQGDLVREVLEDDTNYRSKEIMKDSGGRERILIAQETTRD